MRVCMVELLVLQHARSIQLESWQMAGLDLRNVAAACLMLLWPLTLGMPDVAFMDWGGRRMISVSRDTCRVHGDKNSISWMMSRMPRGSVRQIGKQEMRYMTEACKYMRQPHTRPFIYPGTKWCGSGTIARSYQDLGALKYEDRCCREHDYCPASLPTGHCKNGLCNSSPFTRSHCECDMQFRRCLQTVGSSASHALGALYFNIARVPCFSELRTQPTRVARTGFPYKSCGGPNNPCYRHVPQYRYHRLAPYSLPFFSFPLPSYPNSFRSIVPTKISNALLTLFRFVGAV